MSSIRVKCTSCGSRLKAPKKLAGKETRCPKCDAQLVVPDPDESVESRAAALLKSVEDTPSRLSNVVSSPEIKNGVLFVCPFCEESYRVARDMVGRSILCRNCQASAPVKGKPKKDWEDDEIEISLRRSPDESESLTSIMSLRGMPRPLVREFKAWCNRHGVTMKDQVTELIRKCVREG